MKKIAIITLAFLFAITLQGCSIMNQDILEKCFSDEDCTSMDITHNEENMINLMSHLMDNVDDFEYDVTLHYYKKERFIHRIMFEIIDYEGEYTLVKHIHYRDLLHEINTVINDYFEEIYEGKDLDLEMMVTFTGVEIFYHIPIEPYHEQLTFDVQDFGVDSVEYYSSIVKELYIVYPDIRYNIIYDFHESTGIDYINQYFDVNELEFDIYVYSRDVALEDNTIIDFFTEQFDDYRVVFNFK